MRWPWEKAMKGMKRQVADEVTAPAHDEVVESQKRLSRINRILQEARDAESLLARIEQQRR